MSTSCASWCNWSDKRKICFLFVYFRSGCLRTLHKCLRSNISHGLRAVCKVILIPQLILHTAQQQHVLCTCRKTECCCQHARLQLRRNTTIWRLMRGVNKNVHVLEPCCQMEIFSGPQWTQWSKSRAPHFAATVDHNSGWDTNRRRSGITRACGLSLAKVTQTHTHTHTHTATPQPEAATARFPDI